jgi:acetylornithine deacetylase/succinyl-diaminopimelate desuccinylase-like protein
LVKVASSALRWLGMETVYDASSTDANIPIGLNSPSLCIGITHGGRGHTIEEYISLPPVELGLAQLIRLCVDATALISSRSN